MRWILFVLCAAAPIFANSPRADAPKSGTSSYGAETLSSLEMLGTVKLQGTTISHLLKITGNLTASNAHLHQVEAVGNVSLNNTSVAQELEVIGTIKAVDSTFEKPISFLGQKGVFSKCRLTGITVQKDHAFRGTQILELKNGTQVSGPIVFEGEEGKVFLYSGSKVTGTVTGGVIVRKGF